MHKFQLANYHEKYTAWIEAISEQHYNIAWSELPDTEKPLYPPKWINLSENQKMVVITAVEAAQKRHRRRADYIKRVLPLFRVSLVEAAWDSKGLAEVAEKFRNGNRLDVRIYVKPLDHTGNPKLVRS